MFLEPFGFSPVPCIGVGATSTSLGLFWPLSLTTTCRSCRCAPSLRKIEGEQLVLSLRDVTRDKRRLHNNGP